MRQFLIALTALSAIPPAALAAAPKTVTLNVPNMTCLVCPITVRKSLHGIAGVSAVSIEFKQKTAQLTFDQDKAKQADLIAATTNAGFPSNVQP